MLGSNVSQIPSDGSVTKIGDYAFEGCADLMNLEIPETVTNIGDYAFRSTGLVSLKIPSSVISVGFGAFQDCFKLVQIETPIQIESLPSSIFENCRVLSKVKLANSVKTIGSSAFYGCSSLTSIELPNSLTTIARSAFSESGICEILIPKNVNNIGLSILENCSSLSCIQVSKQNTFYNSSGNCLINTQTKTIISTCKSSIIPKDASVEKIGANAFIDWRQRISLIIPNNITSIGVSAFCDNLEKIYYQGTSTEWGNIQIGNFNGNLDNATKYFYSATQPSTAGHYWHYDTDGITPIEW